MQELKQKHSSKNDNKFELLFCTNHKLLPPIKINNSSIYF